jgi:hypothetical protein
MTFKFKPYQHVKILPIEAHGRVGRCTIDGGEQPIYLVGYFMNGDEKRTEFWEDELEAQE